MNDISAGSVAFGIVIIYGIYKVLIEPLIGGGRNHRGYDDHYRRR